jgi:hypothetical protein
MNMSAGIIPSVFHYHGPRRRGEPMICSPADALAMFYGSDLRYLVMEDVLVRKEEK